MRSIVKISFTALLIAMLAGCGSSSLKDEKSSLTNKKAELEKLKAQQKDLNDRIAKLQDAIAKSDPSAVKADNAKLVSLAPVQPGNFAHYIQLQGKIDALNVAYVSPRGGGGQVKAIYIKQGDVVKKGQLLLKLDDELQKKQIDQLKTQLAYAKDLCQRQENLWAQNIGTEVQVLNAKNNVTQLDKQLAFAEEQLSFTNVIAEISGTINIVNVRVGETFFGAPQIQIVNSNDLKVMVQVPEKYIDRVAVGNTLQVKIPEANNKTFETKITVAGKLIDPNTRSFYVEGKIPSDKDFRPNQIAMVGIKDYAANNVITIPMNTLQNDEKGKYVLLAVKEGDKLVARKRPVTVGELSGDRLEVKSGLQQGDQLITEGFQGLYDGQAITTDLK
jgi:RND family efflux transporter MFP subunit